jgi:hypothetical protein
MMESMRGGRSRGSECTSISTNTIKVNGIRIRQPVVARQSSTTREFSLK